MCTSCSVTAVLSDVLVIYSIMYLYVLFSASISTYSLFKCKWENVVKSGKEWDFG